MDPRNDAVEIVYFGAFVAVADEGGTQTTYQIVGEDEVDPDHGRISWRSPLGRALLRRQAGDTVVLTRPSGQIELTVVEVRYA